MNEFLEAYMIKEVSEMIGVPVGTLRQWESDFKGIIEIPRDSKGARYYTDFEIETLKHIKIMRDRKLSKDVIRELLEKKGKVKGVDSISLIPQPYVPQMKQSEAVETLQSIKEMMSGFEEFKGSLIKELREEIRQEVRKDIIEEVCKEIASSSEDQKELIQKNTLATSEQLEDVSGALREMEKRYESEMKRRDEVLMENMRLLQEMKKEQKKGLLGRLFGK
ncbi:MerR family transcriptional regulator [Bacillus solitudinis]|uniref:MerR family transcriptional regulator n=1 Tax=Bacillus solitudinis TaxID=2014074 RepID=UPI000C2411FD|nr:MerR family transcriptional regulator [Bacillus solitudinis]